MLPHSQLSARAAKASTTGCHPGSPAAWRCKHKGPVSARLLAHVLQHPQQSGPVSLLTFLREHSSENECSHDSQRQELERLFRAVQTWPLVSVRVGDTSQQQQPPPSAAAPPTPSEQACQLTALSHSAQRQVGASTERLVVVPVPTTVLQVQLGNGPEPPKQKQNKERHDDFYANVGDAIRTLRDDIPDLFRDDLNYAIYREDVVFRDPRNCFRGLKNYRTIFWSLRFHGRLFFQDLFVEVVRIWQKTDDTICMRWTVHGIPRLPWDAEGIFDGVSTYKLDSHGKIYEHKVDNVIFRDPPMLRIPFLARLTLSPIPQSQPVPGAWFDGAHLPSIDCVSESGPFATLLPQHTDQPSCSGL